MRSMRAPVAALLLPIGLVTLGGHASAQVATEAPPAVPGAAPAVVERISVAGASLEGNLEGNAAARDVLVVLPPSYASSDTRRYPVVYALHGYSIGAEQWAREIHVPLTISNAFAQGAQEMIVVLPDARTRHDGSMYSSSVTTGDFERFVARDLVEAIDRRYRTLPDRRSRGLVGHSMGGYGATRIGMKHADQFGSLYVMSPCCLSPRGAGPAGAELEKQVAAASTPAALAALPFMARAQLATAAAWSPNPAAPPLFLDLPTRDGVPRPDVLARWAANSPLAFLDQYVSQLKRYAAIGLDVGDQDGLRRDTSTLHEALDRYGISHAFDVYEGNHTNKVAQRFQAHVLPFFSRHLCATSPCP